MGKTVVMLSASPGRGGNSDAPADAFRHICPLATAADDTVQGLKQAAQMGAGV